MLFSGRASGEVVLLCVIIRDFVGDVAVDRPGRSDVLDGLEDIVTRRTGRCIGRRGVRHAVDGIIQGGAAGLYLEHVDVQAVTEACQWVVIIAGANGNLHVNLVLYLSDSW